VLLVHGLLHLVGFDHEQGEQQLQSMAAQEAGLLRQLGWEGSGLISLAAEQDDTDSGLGSSGPGQQSDSSSSSSSTSTSSSFADSPTGSVASASSSSSSSSSSRWVCLQNLGCCACDPGVPQSLSVTRQSQVHAVC
jgi:hypothetical protein